MTFIAYLFQKLQTAKYLARKMTGKLLFNTPFESQHVNGSQRILISARPNFYHIFSSLWWK